MKRSSLISFAIAVRNAVLKVAAFWVLLVAAYLAIGRQFFPYIDRLTPEVEIWLSEQLGTNVKIGQLQGDWVRFNPVIHLQDVQLGDRLSVHSMTLAPGIFESLARGGLSFIRFEVNDFSADAVQNEDGWQIIGLAKGGSDNVSVDLDTILALIRRQHEVVFNNVTLNIKPYNLPPFTLLMQDGRLNSIGQDNGLVANAYLQANDYQVPIELQLETSKESDGLNRLYVRHGEIDLSPWLVNLIPNLSEAIIAGEYWIQIEGDHWASASVRQTVRSLTMAGSAHSIELQDGKAEVFLTPQREGLSAVLNVQNYKLNGESFGATQARVNYADKTLALQWDSLPAQWIKHSLALEDTGGFWLGLSPAGAIEQGRLQVQTEQPESLRLQASFANLSLQSYDAVPGLTALSGSLRISGNRGELSVAPGVTQVSLPSVLARPYAAQIKEASLNWLLKSGEGAFASGTGDLQLQPPAEDAAEGALPMQIAWRSDTASRTAKARGRESSLALRLEAPAANHFWAAVMIGSEQVDPNVSAMINHRLEAGQFHDLQLDYLKSFAHSGNIPGQFFIAAGFDDTEVSFLDSWQSLQGLNGRLYLDADGVSLRADKAIYPGLALRDLHFDYPFDDHQISVHLEGQGEVPEMLDFMQSGPLRPLYGNQFDSWQGTGQAALSLDLTVPLKKPSDFNIQVDTRIQAPQLQLEDLDIAVTDLRGVLHYNRQQGVYGKGIHFNHQGYPQTLAVTSDLQADSARFTFDISGQTALSYWGERFGDRYVAQLDDVVAHKTRIDASSQSVQIVSQSDLTDLALSLPPPLTKTAGEALPMQLTVNFDQKDWRIIRLDLGDAMRSYIELNQDSQLQRATIAYGMPLNVRQENGIYLDAKVDTIDGDVWWQQIKKLTALYADSDANANADEPDVGSLFRALHLEAQHLTYLDQPWTQSDVTLLRNESAWLVSFNAEEGQGKVLVPLAEGPIFAELQWIDLTTGEEEVPFAQQVDPLADFKPDDIPDMQISINKLIWNKQDFGHWKVQLASSPGQLKASKIEGEFAGATFTGTLDWTLKDGQQQTQVDGKLKLKNIVDVLNVLKYAPVLTSRKGELDLSASWRGSPAFFDSRRIKGRMGLSLERGAIKTANDYEGVKLIGLLNFTRVLQRIALDFSDLLDSGITYDSIDGEVLFDRGFGRVGDHLTIDGSAMKFQFSGDADLLTETLDVDVVITVPLSSTFPLVALLAGVSPQAAAAIYVTERVFNNNLERISSARMHVTGSFDDPQTKFYRVDERKAANSANSKTIRDRAEDGGEDR